MAHALGTAAAPLNPSTPQPLNSAQAPLHLTRRKRRPRKRRPSMKSRYTRFAVLLLLYAAAATASYWLAWRLRFGFYPGLDGIPPQFADKIVWQGVGVVSFKLLCLYALGQFTGLVRFFRLPDAIRLFVIGSMFFWNADFF